MIARVSPVPSNAPINARRWPNRAPASDLFVALYKDLVCHWRTYDSEGELVDLQGNPPGYTLLQAVGTPSFAFAGDVSSYSLLFNGTTDFLVAVGDQPLYNPGTSFTWRVRVRLADKSGSKTILRYGTLATPVYELSYSHIANRFQWVVLDAGGSQVPCYASALGSPVVGTWYTLVVYVDLTRRQIGIRAYTEVGDEFLGSDFPPQATTNFATLHSGAINGTLDPMFFGVGRPGGGYGNYWSGNMSHFLFYKRLLNPFEESAVVGFDYAQFPGLVASGFSAPPPAVPAAPSGLLST